jgi:hypothetical protein
MVFCDNNYDLCEYIFPQNVLEAQLVYLSETFGLWHCIGIYQLCFWSIWTVALHWDIPVVLLARFEEKYIHRDHSCYHKIPSNAMPLFKCFRNTTGVSQCNVTVQMLQKHNWCIPMQCHSPNASEAQLVYLNAMPLFKCFRNLRYTSCVSEAFEQWHCIEIHQLCFWSIWTVALQWDINATVQILQKHNWCISMQCQSSNASVIITSQQ